jgi:integrase
MDTTTSTTTETTTEAAPTTPTKAKRKGKARAHGEGSVSYEASTGKWRVSVSVGYVNGKRRRKQLRFDSQQEARHALTKLRKQLDDGVGVGDDRMTVRAFLDRWLADVVNAPTSTIRVGTRAGYALNVRRHLAPGLGHIPLAKLGPQHVQAFLNTKLTEVIHVDEDGTKHTLSARTVQYLHANLRNALKHAERWGLVSRNVAKLVDAPKLPKHEAQSLTIAQAGKLLAAVNGDRSNAKDEKRRALTEPDRLRALFSVAVAMGLRRGEIVGLRWENVDLDAGVLRVREQVQRVKVKRDENGKKIGGGLVVQDLKTDKSRRTLKVPAAVLDELREHAKRQKAERLRAGPLWTETGYVFSTTTGTPLDGRNVHRQWREALDDAGLPALPFHASRHTAASFLLAQGADLRTVMGVLGHSQIALTANTYTHVLEELHADAAVRMDAAFRAARDSARR